VQKKFFLQSNKKLCDASGSILKEQTSSYAFHGMLQRFVFKIGRTDDEFSKKKVVIDARHYNLDNIKD
jgi:hypothetical protein